MITPTKTMFQFIALIFILFVLQTVSHNHTDIGSAN